MTSTPSEDTGATADDALKRRLLNRIAVAAVMVVGLLGSLAIFDAIYAPKRPAKMASLPTESADGASTPVEAKTEVKSGDTASLSGASGAADAVASTATTAATIASTATPAGSAAQTVASASASGPSAANAPGTPGTAGATNAVNPTAPPATVSAAPTTPSTGAANKATGQPSPAKSVAGKPEVKAVAEGTSAVGAPPLLPLPSEKGLTKPATAKPASIRPSEPVAAANSLAARPDPGRVIARSPRTATPGVAPRAPASRPLSLVAEPHFALQMGVFTNLANAEDLRAKLELHGIPSTIEARVHVGPFATREEADAARAKLKELGLDGGLLVSFKK